MVKGFTNGGVVVTANDDFPGYVNYVQYFDEIQSAPVTEGIEAAEDSWRGGIADFGDREAAMVVQAMPGYFDYRSHLETAAFEFLGDTFVVYRLMARAQYDSWLSGDDIGPIAVTARRSFAASFAKFAGFRDGAGSLGVYRIVATPGSIVMRGKEEEFELVVDGNEIPVTKVTLLEEV